MLFNRKVYYKLVEEEIIEESKVEESKVEESKVEESKVEEVIVPKKTRVYFKAFLDKPEENYFEMPILTNKMLFKIQDLFSDTYKNSDRIVDVFLELIDDTQCKTKKEQLDIYDIIGILNSYLELSVCSNEDKKNFL